MQREIRYIVIKRKHLTDGHERHLLGYLTDIGVDTIESVVVEHDWPEYEAVWDMIEARVDGKPSRIATLEAQLAEAGEAVKRGHDAIAEYYRYWTGGETRGSYDGKPERNGLWEARETMRIALAKIGGNHDG